MPEIKLTIGERTVTAPSGFDLADFIKTEGLEARKVYCGQLDPPIPISGTEFLEYVHFIDFFISGSKIKFMVPERINVDIPQIIKSLTLKIITPVPVPLLKTLNSKIKSSSDRIFAHVFFLPHLKRNVSDLEYIDNIVTDWIDLKECLNLIINQAGKGSFRRSVGIMEVQSILPSLTPLDSFFDTQSSYEQGERTMILVVSSLKQLTFRIQGGYVSVENVPQCLKDIINRIHKVKKLEKRPYNTIERRIIKVCLNGGIPVNFFDSPEISIKYDERKLKAADFQQLELYLGDFKTISGNILDKLRSFVEDLKDHLFNMSSEAAMRLIFWDPVINRMLQHGLEGSKKNYLIEPEWDTGCLFEEHRKQRVDSAVTFELGGKRYPMLLIEVGKEPFDLNNPHKDHSKLLGILSQSCLSLSYGLIAAKKQLEEARTCGVWIGGPVIQLLTAHPVATKLPDGTFEIHVNISMNSHWLYNLNQATVPRNCDGICCKPSREDSFKFERLKEAELKLENYKFLTEDIENALDDPSLNEPVISVENRCSAPSPLDVKVKLVTGEINFDALMKLNFFIQYVKNRITFILSEDSNNVQDARTFRNQPRIGVFVESRGSSNSITPQKYALTDAFGQKSLKSPLAKKRKTKNSLKELEILLKLAKFPNNFPVVYDFSINSDGDQIISYEFEYMEEIAASSRIFVHESSLGLFYSALTFALDCLYGMFLLHEVIGVIHSDISLNNIMFSYLHETWKLIDFNQSLEISESLKTKRVAGTPGYIAPEALESGIFTKESDVFSLGQVLMNLFDIIILCQIIVNDEDEEITDEIRELGHQFGLILRAMTHPNPSYRPSIIKCLEKIYEIVKSIGFTIDEVKYSPIIMLLKQYREIKQLQEGLEKVHVEIDPKRVRVTEEKEQIFSGIQTIE